MRHALASAITGYQRYLSAWKSYCCAHNALHKRGSCSAFGKRLVLRAGLWRFLTLIPPRFAACHDASRAIAAVNEQTPERNPGEGMRTGDKVAAWCLADAATNATCCLVM